MRIGQVADKKVQVLLQTAFAERIGHQKARQQKAALLLCGQGLALHHLLGHSIHDIIYAHGDMTSFEDALFEGGRNIRMCVTLQQLVIKSASSFLP